MCTCLPLGGRPLPMQDHPIRVATWLKPAPTLIPVLPAPEATFGLAAAA